MLPRKDPDLKLVSALIGIRNAVERWRSELSSIFLLHLLIIHILLVRILSYTILEVFEVKDISLYSMVTQGNMQLNGVENIFMKFVFPFSALSHSSLPPTPLFGPFFKLIRACD
jgi:hypothetical protein